MGSHNLLKQYEEMTALKAIYEKNFKHVRGTAHSYCIKIEENRNEAEIHIDLPKEYPNQSPPKCDVLAHWMDKRSKEKLHKDLNEIYKRNEGQVVVFQYVEKVRDLLYSVETKDGTMKIKTKEKRIKGKGKSEGKSKSKVRLDHECPEIHTTDVIADRKSIFQGHAAVVHSFEQVQAVLARLKENKKIFNATHNMFAYRIEQKKGKKTSILEDCNNDGENLAGGRLLHLMQVSDVKNGLVVVSRWYGGIQIGSDRFRHINNAAREALKDAGLLVTK